MDLVAIATSGAVGAFVGALITGIVGLSLCESDKETIDRLSRELSNEKRRASRHLGKLRASESEVKHYKHLVAARVDSFKRRLTDVGC